MKLGLIITVDYEVPQHVPVDVRRYLIDPTEKLIALCQSHQAKLTIMAEVAELIAFEKEENSGFRQSYPYDVAAEIRMQLSHAVRSGHDVQLHLHPQWLGAKWEEGSWNLDFLKYRLPILEYEDIVKALSQGKQYLEKLLKPHNNNYACVAFRSGNWNTQPSLGYLRALKESGIRSDTSVFKWGYKNSSGVFFDYRNAHSNVLPWYCSATDINCSSHANGILEIPIYAENVYIWSMLTVKRLQTAFRYFPEDQMVSSQVEKHRLAVKAPRATFEKRILKFCRKVPKKLDFCKLTSGEMLKMLSNVDKEFKHKDYSKIVPIVMIGHSKEIRKLSDLDRFLHRVRNKYSDRVTFLTLAQFIETY